MNNLLIATLCVLGLVSILLAWKKQDKLVPMFQVLLAATVIQWSASAYDENAQFVFHAMTGVLVLAYILAQFIPSKMWSNALIPFALSLGFFFLFGSKEMVFQGESFVPVPKFMLVGLVLATLGMPIAALKMKLFKRWIPADEAAQWLKAFYLLLGGIALFLGFFAASWFGVLLIGVAFLISGMFQSEGSGRVGISVLVLSLIPILIGDAQVDPSLLKGDVIEGLLFGAFGIFFLRKVWKAKNVSVVSLILSYFFAFAVVLGLGLAGSVEQMGGMDAYIGVLVGAALMNAVLGSSFVGVSYFAPVLAFGLILPSLLMNEEEVEAQSGMVNMQGGVDENGEEIAPPKTLPLTELSGNYSLIADSSQIQFTLGKNGETKGRFKKVTGTISIASEIAQSNINVTMKMADFTTYNKMRDDHLMGDEYFNSSKYPEMRFKSSAFKELGEDRHEVTGTFVMLGVSKTVTLTLQRIELNDKIAIVGSGSLDRTEFGMTPSAVEGNVVSYEFILELKQ